MLNQKLEQKGGKKSINFQAENMTVYQGLSYTDARKIALEVFRDNILKLSQEAALVARKRAEELTDAFLQKLVDQHPKFISILENPDFQFSLYDAQREYARSGEKELENILIEILVERATIDSDFLRKIFVNEAIRIAPKLTQIQLNILSLTYLINDYFDPELNSLQKLNLFLLNYITPLFTNIDTKDVDFKHIIYTGCCSLTPPNPYDNYSSRKIIDKFYQKYLSNFSKGFTMKNYETHRLYQSDGVQTEEIPISNTIHNSRGKLQKYIIPLNDEKDLYKFNILNSNELKKILLSEFPDISNAINELHNYYYGLMSTYTLGRGEAEKLFLSQDAIFQKLNEIYTNTSLNALELTSVGSYLAVLNLKIKLGKSFTLKVEL